MNEFYIKDVKGGKEKYEITFDREKLQELMVKIATHCGEKRKKHGEFKYGSIPSNNHFTYKYENYITNVETKLSKNKGVEWDHYEEYEVDLFICNYIEYKCPPLIEYISRLLYRDKKAIETLFKGDFRSLSKYPRVSEKIPGIKRELSKLKKEYEQKRKKKTEDLDKEYESINQESQEIEKKLNKLQKMMQKAEQELGKLDSDYEEKRKALQKQLNELLSILELNEKQEPVMNYLIELLSLIEYRLVDTITNEEIKRVNDFYKKEVTKEPIEKPKQFSIKK